MGVLKYPYPYKAWFTIANDPDNTLIEDWHELNEYIWNELNLPFSNSLFVQSFNLNLPLQVNLVDHPEILNQPHDTIHTWGDFMHSGKRGFDRNDAEESILLLQKYNLFPKIWVDHASFVGNLLHNTKFGSTPETFDQSGHSYKQLEYTLDLIYQFGIRYIWDGQITHVIGQDVSLEPVHFFMKTSSTRPKGLVKLILHWLLPSTLRTILKIEIPENRQYYIEEFPDGTKLYCFRRYGTWKDADIYGLARLISPAKIDQLIRNKGTMVAYTHLGKRMVTKMDENFHIPEETKKALSYISKQYDNKNVMLSSVSELLDYLVIRDNLRFDEQKREIVFREDGIRFTSISQSTLTGKTFSFKSNKNQLDHLKVKANDIDLKFDLKEHTSKIFSISFN